LAEFSIPVDDLGFKPLIMNGKTASNPAGLVAANP